MIVALGGISAHRHLCASDADPSPGWWECVAGSGRALNRRRYQLLGVDFLDGGEGPDGRPERIVTTHHQADALAAVLDELGVHRIHALVGASYGGMVALAFAERYPERIQRLVVIGAAHRTHPMATAWRVAQRRIVELGLETGRAHDALAIARGIAMTTYRSRQELAARFDAGPDSLSENDAHFPVEAYLRHHGERFAERWTAARFLALSLSTDLHEVAPPKIRTPATLVAQQGDLIVPRAQTEQLAREIGAPCRIVDLLSEHGHDAFLTEPQRLGVILEHAIASSLS